MEPRIMVDPVLITYYGGIVLGCLVLLAVLIVFINSRKLGPGGLVLTLVGFCLVGLSIWKDLDVNFTQGHFHASTRDILLRAPAESVPNLAPSIVTSVKYKVSILNASSVVDDKEVELVVRALQKQVIEHLSPVWGVSADLNFVSKGQSAPPGNWIISILDDADQAGALGYHDLSVNGLPFAKVFARTAISNGASWTVTASHELVNMLVNPRANLTVFISSSASNESGGKLYPVEIATPCQAEEDGYSIDEVLVSDFVYPSWFEPSTKPNTTRFDYQNLIKKPLEVRRGGYISVYEVKGGAWKPIFSN